MAAFAFAPDYFPTAGADGGASVDPGDPVFGTDGLFYQIGERIPLLNQGIQELHRASGRTDNLLRAQERNPIGPDGAVTQAFEHIPLLCDGIEAMHRWSGHDAAA